MILMVSQEGKQIEILCFICEFIKLNLMMDVSKNTANNIIAESIFLQVNDEGHEYLLLDEITDHRKDGSAIERDDAWICGYNGNKHMQHTMKGWDLCIVWKDKSTSWEPLHNMKELYPVC